MFAAPNDLTLHYTNHTVHAPEIDRTANSTEAVLSLQIDQAIFVIAPVHLPDTALYNLALLGSAFPAASAAVDLSDGAADRIEARWVMIRPAAINEGT